MPVPKPSWTTLAKITLAAAASPSLAALPTRAEALEVIAQARATHAAGSLAFRLAPRHPRLSEVRIRSGSLALHLEAVEIVFADGGYARVILQQSLSPGHRSRPIAVDSRRPVSEILVSKRPGMRPGETLVQVLGKVADHPQP